MLKFKFLNLAKPKKVFEKLNKMDRKQAYTVGAIIVVAVIALLMFVASFSSEENPMEGMNPRGYDLAAMPFVNDLAEQALLASRYPDMQGEGASFLYTPEEKAQRQEEDEYELIPVENFALDGSESSEQAGANGEAGSQAVGGSGSGKGRGYAGRGTGRATTEVGKLEKGGMAASGGSGVGTFWGPSVNNRGLQGQAGYVAPAQLKTDDARKTLGQFRTASIAASRLRDNKMANARKAMQGGHVQGSQAFGKDGIDVSKLGGLALDTSELPKTTDLGNLDDAVDNAVKDQAKPEKPDEKLGFWEQLGQDLLRQAAGSLVDSVMTGVGDSIKGWVNGNSASRAAGKKAWAEKQGKAWNELDASDRKYFQSHSSLGCNEDTWGTSGCKATYGNAGKYLSSVAAERQQAYANRSAQSIGSTKSTKDDNKTQIGAGNDSQTCTDTCKEQKKSGGSIVKGVCVCN